MSRIKKAKDILDLATTMQASYKGVSLEDIRVQFSCSRRSAERMRNGLYELFPMSMEVFEEENGLKRWRLKKGTVNHFINITESDLENLENIKNSMQDNTQKQQIENVLNKIKAVKNKI